MESHNFTHFLDIRSKLRGEGKRLVFTNGCFDILHAGHVAYLSFARKQGDVLVVAVNSDASVRAIKGPCRPINNQNDRAFMLAALKDVDHVIIFDENNPQSIIEQILPDVLVKGEDWKDQVCGTETVHRNGGQIILAPLLEGKSTTNIVERIINAYGVQNAK